MCTVFVLTETKAEQTAEQTKNKMEIFKIKIEVNAVISNNHDPWSDYKISGRLCSIM